MSIRSTASSAARSEASSGVRPAMSNEVEEAIRKLDRLIKQVGSANSRQAAEDLIFYLSQCNRDMRLQTHMYMASPSKVEKYEPEIKQRIEQQTMLTKQLANAQKKIAEADMIAAEKQLETMVAAVKEAKDKKQLDAALDVLYEHLQQLKENPLILRDDKKRMITNFTKQIKELINYGFQMEQQGIEEQLAGGVPKAIEDKYNGLWSFVTKTASVCLCTMGNVAASAMSMAASAVVSGTKRAREIVQPPVQDICRNIATRGAVGFQVAIQTVANLIREETVRNPREVAAVPSLGPTSTDLIDALNRINPGASDLILFTAALPSSSPPGYVDQNLTALQDAFSNSSARTKSSTIATDNLAEEQNIPSQDERQSQGENILNEGETAEDVAVADVSPSNLKMTSEDLNLLETTTNRLSTRSMSVVDSLHSSMSFLNQNRALISRLQQQLSAEVAAAAAEVPEVTREVTDAVTEVTAHYEVSPDPSINGLIISNEADIHKNYEDNIIDEDDVQRIRPNGSQEEEYVNPEEVNAMYGDINTEPDNELKGGKRKSRHNKKARNTKRIRKGRKNGRGRKTQRRQKRRTLKRRKHHRK